MGASSGPDIITDGLIYYLDGSNLKCYPGSGTSLTSLVSGSITTGTMSGGVSYNPMPRGFFSFDGTDDYIQCGSVGGGVLVTGTLSIWYSIKNISNGGSFTIGTNSYESLLAKENEWGIFIFGDVVSGARISSYDWGNATNRIWDSSATDLTGTWVNLTLTFNAINTTTTNNANGYVNGILKSTFTYKQGTVPKPQHPLRMGAQGSPSTPVQFLGPDARLNYPMVYNRVLEQSEILQNYYAIKGRLPATPAPSVGGGSQPTGGLG